MASGKKILLFGVVVGSIPGTAVGFALGIFFFPYLFPPPAINETVADSGSRTVVASGEFIHANPADPVHYGKGGYTLYHDLLHLETNFEVGPGPKYHVYLVPLDEVKPSSPVDETMYVDLGRLKAFSGSQNYPVPNGINLQDFGSIVIWCEQFNILISPAKLEFK
ncbi:MAG: DM13 domain-containing protein [Gammaproteobacteria bacterium]